jgi:BolA family transcriptional regulator, general stress-responsive regulator|tara:strand:- start:277 stop:537 length:261 start_codon:yes stop_codon:yes gene_type:complete
MDINELIAIVKKKLMDQININSIKIEDKSFIHKNHVGNEDGKFHLKITIDSMELKTMNRIESNKKIYKVLENEVKNFIHSIQILIT